MKKIKEIKVGEQFKIAGKILSFVQHGTTLKIQMEGMYETQTWPIPELKEVEDYFEKNGYTRESGAIMWNHYENAIPPWTDKYGEPVKSWKQKCFSTWFKNADKIQDKTTQKPVMVR